MGLHWIRYPVRVGMGGVETLLWFTLFRALRRRIEEAHNLDWSPDL